MNTIYGHNAVPHLFDDMNGISRQLARYIANQERLARHERRDDDAGRIPLDTDFNARGFAKICDDLLKEIFERQQLPKHTGHCDPDGNQRHKDWCYALHVYCANHGKRATPELMCLTFKVLGCKILKPDVELKKDLGITYRRKQAQFDAALDLDAEHWARHGRRYPEDKLAALVSERVGTISGRKIRDWRGEDEYVRKIRFSVGRWLGQLDELGEKNARHKATEAFNLRSGGKYVMRDGKPVLVERTRNAKGRAS